MQYLQVDNLTKYYGEFHMFDNISFVLNEGEKTALIAKNGTGKTTLLRIITGQESHADGDISINKHIKVGYLEQEPLLDDTKTVFDEVYESSQEIMDAIKEYEQSVSADDQERLQKSMEQMDELKAWDFDTLVKQVLSQLKIENLQQPVAQLSGGQKKRVALAKILIDEPDFLILDEPTNHLDLDMIEWLESYLTRTKMTLFMVTHDRYFLDRVCNTILELDDAQVYKYSGNYSQFLQKKEERVELQKAEISKARNLMRKELDWIRRQPKARGTKSKSRIDAFYDLKKVASQRIDNSQVKINVEAQRLGKKILEFKGLNKSFGDLKILEDFTYKFNRFEKIGIIGANGCGKSTFLNIITGEIPADSGEMDYGETVVVGYYKQDGINLPEDKKVLEVIQDIAESIELSKGHRITASQFLEHFLFPPAVQHMYVSRLSGGERKRLYLMTVLMKQPNFLILDEPTNDLDILTLNILEDYLAQFNGCVIIVSHDRFFTDKIVDHMFVFEGQGVIKDFPGNYSDYRDWEKARQEEKQKQQVEQKKKAEAPKLKQTTNKLTYKERLELEGLENEIAELEDQKAGLESEIASGALSADELVDKSTQIGALMETIEEKEMRWLELSEKNA